MARYDNVLCVDDSMEQNGKMEGMWMNCRKYGWVNEWLLEKIYEIMVAWKSGLYKDGWVGEWTDWK